VLQRTAVSGGVVLAVVNSIGVAGGVVDSIGGVVGSLGTVGGIVDSLGTGGGTVDSLGGVVDSLGVVGGVVDSLGTVDGVVDSLGDVVVVSVVVAVSVVMTVTAGAGCATPRAVATGVGVAGPVLAGAAVMVRVVVPWVVVDGPAGCSSAVAVKMMTAVMTARTAPQVRTVRSRVSRGTGVGAAATDAPGTGWWCRLGMTGSSGATPSGNVGGAVVTVVAVRDRSRSPRYSVRTAATVSGVGRSAGTGPVIDRSRSGHGAGRVSGICGSRSNRAIALCIGVPMNSGVPVTHSSSTNPSE